jgi:hypothetical protein
MYEIGISLTASPQVERESTKVFFGGGKLSGHGSSGVYLKIKMNEYLEMY